ncbi:hypothetical protein BGZ54_002222 [Gamsiella multidivaricata]|nr:hypothetical protein BGZ54_002222 [Gamsiella multidivaricata]
MEASGCDVKEAGSVIFPYVEFEGLTSRGSIRSYIDRAKEQLRDDKSKQKIQRENRERRENLCGEFVRLGGKTAKHLSQFPSFSSIEETLRLFLLRWYILGETVLMLDDQVQLVKAAFGRIKLLGGIARTVLDEPFALKAAENYIRAKGPLFVDAAERAMLRSTNAWVHGNMCETMMPALFVETFKDRPLSSWRLLPNDSIPDLLAGQVMIVGYNEKDPQLGIPYSYITTTEFMKAHFKHNSKRGDKAIPPFYFPSPQVSGPDIIFFVQVNGQYFPVFVQLKLRQALPRSDAEQALATVSSRTIEENLEQERPEQEADHQKPEKQKPPKLQDYCSAKVYISIVISYPAAVVSSRDPIHPDPKLELEPDNLHPVTVRVDDSSFAQIFPEHHVKLLDKLKHFKRGTEDQQDQDQLKKLRVDPN